MLEKLKQILKDEGLRGKDLAELMDYDYDTYRSLTRKNKNPIPKWVRSAIIFYDLGRLSDIKVVDAEIVKPNK